MDKEICQGCDGENTSSCCGASIKWGDICCDCLEHCDTNCEECEYNTDEP